MPEALENIDKIVVRAMPWAWGDLGVELPAHEVPLVQKLIRPKTARIPVIVAQMSGNNDHFHQLVQK
jgi:pyruvate kinase